MRTLDADVAIVGAGGAPSIDLDAFSWRRFMRPEGPLSVI